MKIALVHDYLNQYGGAERVLQILCKMFPDAPVYTTLYDERATSGAFKGVDIRTSFLQRLPLVMRYHHTFSFLMPLAFEQFDFSDYDVVLSVSSSFGKGIITKPSTKHVCYCLTPPRYLWDDAHRYVSEFGYPWIVKKIIPPILSYLRIWDREASLRVDHFAAISHFVKERIAKYYGRTADVIYPPVDLDMFHIAGPAHDYFLMVGRLVTYKKFDLAIKVFNELGWSLKIVGTGVNMKHLQKMANSNIEFLGAVDDQKLADLYAHAQALIFPQEEDFGIVPLEAMASGRPVIAYRGGGAVETIIEGKTGMFFDEQTPESLRAVVESFNPDQFSPQDCRKRAGEFNIDVFLQKIKHFLAV
ncbi:MAG: glycosyltransferase [Patescibacteria group bacterium]